MIRHVWIAYLISTMMYVMPSGLPQPSALLLGAMLFLLLLDPLAEIGPDLYLLIGNLLLFVAWSVIVSLGHFLWSGQLAYMIPALYIIYNALLFAVVVQLACRQPSHFARVTRNSLLFMLVLQVVLVILIPGQPAAEVEREVGTFNNPNQLAYWALLSLSIYMLMPGRRLLLDLAAIAAAGWLLVASASKAGLFAGGVAVLLWLALDLSRKGRIWVLLAASIAASGVLAISYHGNAPVPQSGHLSLLQDRLERSAEEPDDTLAGRGYMALWSNIALLPFGAGEGDFADLERGADGVFLPGELHSTLGTILMSYGLVGFILFLGFAVAIVRCGSLASGLWLVPAMIYGVAHQGLRFSPFWILLACIAAGRVLASIGASVRQQDHPLRTSLKALDAPAVASKG